MSRNFGIPVGFIEAKDIGDKDLEGAKKTGNKEQFDRYKASLNNLMFTDYLDFHLYRDGVFITKITIGQLPFSFGEGWGEVFWKLVKLGGELRQIHLLESPIVEKYITGYPEDGDNVVVKPRYEVNPVRVLNSDRVVGKVYINETQYFDNVPQVAWEFYIGGYQPAQ